MSIIYPVGVQLNSDSNSHNTVIAVDIDNEISNIIDGQRGTFWFRNVYLESIVPKVTTVMEFYLGNGMDISSVHLEGNTQEPFFVEEIQGIGTDGSRTVLYNTKTEVNGKKRIDFNSTFVQAVQITFAVYTYHKADYLVAKDTDECFAIVFSISIEDMFSPPEIIISLDLSCIFIYPSGLVTAKSPE